MRESEKRDVYNAAIEVLVKRAVDRKQPDAPEVYAAKVRTDLGKRHYERARGLFDTHGNLTADELLTLLAPPSAPQPKPDEAPNPTSAIPTYEAETWEPLPDESRKAAREHIAALKQIVANTPKAEVPQ